MDKTISTYRMAIEYEITHWKNFLNALASEEKYSFVEIIDMCRIQAIVGSNACKPVLFDPMAMSILLGQQKKIRQLENQIKEAKAEQTKGANIDIDKCRRS